MLNRFQPAASRARSRSASVVSRIGSTAWMRKGSMIVCQRSIAGGYAARTAVGAESSPVVSASGAVTMLSPVRLGRDPPPHRPVADSNDPRCAGTRTVDGAAPARHRPEHTEEHMTVESPGAATAAMHESGRGRWLGLAMLSLGVSMIIVDATIVNVAVPSIIRDLHMDSTTAEWINTIYA